MAESTEVQKVKIVTPLCKLSYPTLFTPRAIGDSTVEKYSTALCFTKDSTEDGLPDANIKPMKEAALAVAVSRWPEAVEMIKKGKLTWPFREDAEQIAEKGYDAFNIFCFMNSNSKQQPSVVGAHIDPSTGKLVVITDPSLAYAGVIARASLTAYTYDVRGNKGVTFGLNHVQIVTDGERMDGRSSPDGVFDALAEAPSLADFEETTGTDEAPAEDADALADLMGS